MESDYDIPILYAASCVIIKEAIKSLVNECDITQDIFKIWDGLLDGAQLDDIPLDLDKADIGYPSQPLYLHIALKCYLISIKGSATILHDFKMVDVTELELFSPDVITLISSLIGDINENIKVSEQCFGLQQTMIENLMSFFTTEKPWDLFHQCQCVSDEYNLSTQNSYEELVFRCRVNYEYESYTRFSISSYIFKKVIILLKMIDLKILYYMIGLRYTIGSVVVCLPSRSVLERSFNMLHKVTSKSILTVGAR